MKCATHSGTWAVGEPGWQQGLPCGMLPIPRRRPRPQDGVARGTGMGENGRRRRVEETWSIPRSGAGGTTLTGQPGRSRSLLRRTRARWCNSGPRTRARLQIPLRQWQAFGNLTPRRARRRASEALTFRCPALPERPVPRRRDAGDRGRHPGAPSRQPVRLGQDSDRFGSMRSSKRQPRYGARPHPAARCLRCVQAYD
jgi:hypothetical protein